MKYAYLIKEYYRAESRYGDIEDIVNNIKIFLDENKADKFCKEMNDLNKSEWSSYYEYEEIELGE